MPGSGIHTIEIDAAAASGCFRIDGDPVKCTASTPALVNGQRIGYTLKGMGVQLLVNGFPAEQFRLGVKTRRWLVPRNAVDAVTELHCEGGVEIDLDVDDAVVYVDRKAVEGSQRRLNYGTN